MVRVKSWIMTLAMVAACNQMITVQGEEPVNKQVLELRTYTLKDESVVPAVDKYMSEALIPALNRLGISPVGAFKLAPQQPAAPAAANAATPQATAAGIGQSDSPLPSPKLMLLLPAKDATTIAMVNARVAADGAYQKAADDYLKASSDQPLIGRISSELLVSFDAWPEVKVPKQAAAGSERLYELRTYESPSEQLGHLKVEMFNSGEVPIFLDCQIQPVFMGQAVIGGVMPNLTYMTVYNNAEELAAAWKRFADHPQWKVLREEPKYKGTVTKIHKSNWIPAAYSQL